MLEFHSPTIEDKQWVDSLLRLSAYQGCEYCFGNILIWSAAYRVQIARRDDFFVAKSIGNNPEYCFPAGRGNLKTFIETLISDARENGHKFTMFAVTENQKAILDELFEGRFIFEPYRDGFDYIYKSADLIELAGKKYHSKRNHITSFMKLYDWSLEEIHAGNIKTCCDLTRLWAQNNQESVDDGSELQAIKLAVEHYFDLGFRGALLYANGNPVAFTMGEELRADTFCTHFEKADSQVRGAYPMINREFAQRFLSSYTYINREDDIGSEGLRKAKLSYYPAILLEKNRVFLREEHG